MSEKNYELFRERAKAENRSIASLIRDSMAEYLSRTESRPVAGDGEKTVVNQLLPGPGRYRIYAEVSEAE